MTRHLFIFLGTFLVGALITLAARTAVHDPHANHGPAPASQPSAPAAPAVDHSLHAAAPVGDHSGHTSAPTAAAAKTPVNTVCAICGMKVDPSVPTAEYQGKTIGFGCRMCPPKFKASPDKYGPAYLRNEVLPK